MNKVFYIAVYGDFEFRVYLTPLQYSPRWSINRSYEKAFKFAYPHYAKHAVQTYCSLYGTKPEQFHIIKITEEKWEPSW